MYVFLVTVAGTAKDVALEDTNGDTDEKPLEVLPSIVSKTPKEDGNRDGGYFIAVYIHAVIIIGFLF